MATAALYRHRWTLIRAPIAAATVLAAWAAWAWLFPMPDSRLVISAGQRDGAYHQIASRYVDAFARHGVELVVLESEGSAQNLLRLRGQTPAADLALVQGGFGWSSPTLERGEMADVQTLANVDIEGVWVFSKQRDLHSLVQLRGLRVAAGPAGSGHRVLAQRLLHQLRVRSEEIRWDALSGSRAGDALVRGDVDAVFMVASADSPAVRRLLALPGIYLSALQRTAALSERNNFLEPRLLAQDMLGAGTPSRDVALLTTHTHLIARQDLHPALKRLATLMALQVHAGPGPFHRAGDFPTLRHGDFPSAAEARDALASGPGWLEQHLSFSWSQALQRLLVIGVPLGIFAWWLARLLPAWLRWRLESRLTRWYGELKFIENDLSGDTISGLALRRFNERLARMDTALASLKLPAELAQRWYTLHQHIEFVRQRVSGMRGR